MKHMPSNLLDQDTILCDSGKLVTCMFTAPGILEYMYIVLIEAKTSCKSVVIDSTLHKTYSDSFLSPATCRRRRT